MRSDILSSLRPALALTLLFALLLGLAYPLAMTGAGRLLFPAQANGSLVQDAGGTVRGSMLIGQAFAGPGYFHARPSAAGSGYDALASSGSNLGSTSAKLIDRVKAAQASEGAGAPPDLLLASGSGLDPHISPAAAAFQAERVARARRLPVAEVQALIARVTEGRQAGVLGEPRVHVLALNLALDRRAGRR